MMVGRPRGRRSSVLVALLARSCASIAVPTRVTDVIDAAAYSRAKRRAVSESWTQKLEVDDFLSRAGLANEQSARPPPFVLDVRAPCEYEKGHIPGAISFPLFDDAERAEVGTLFKVKGQEAAVARGIELLDAKAPTFLDALPDGLQSGDELLVYCKRGGMRSGGMAQLLSEGDLRVHTLQACTPLPCTRWHACTRCTPAPTGTPAPLHPCTRCRTTPLQRRRACTAAPRHRCTAAPLHLCCQGGYQGYRAWANASWAAMERQLVILGGKTGSGKTAVLLALRNEFGAQVLDLGPELGISS